MAGLFITFEGPEGSGKTTIANMVLDTLKQEGHKIYLITAIMNVENQIL